MSEEYWDGAVWVYQADITNDAMDAAAQSYTIVPGAGNEMEILTLELFNGDTSTRTLTADMDDGTNRLIRLITVSAAAANGFPLFSLLSDNQTPQFRRVILAGTMRLVVTLAAVAVSEDSALGVTARLRGGLPTVTEAASAGVPVISINTERVE